jgi:hypothetical protein
MNGWRRCRFAGLAVDRRGDSNMRRVGLVFVFAIALFTTSVEMKSVEGPTFLTVSASYSGMCDASAAVSVGADHFVVGNDEDNPLRIFKYGKPDAVAAFPMDDFLQVDPKNPEADIEGAATIGPLTFWITSHGRNKNAKERTSRYRLFATRVDSKPSFSIKGEGHPYKDLLSDLLEADKTWHFKFKEASELAPEADGGLNIEGLAAAGDSLLIAFRNPLDDGRAIILTLTNPVELVSGSARAHFADPIRLDLKSPSGKPRGIRDVHFVPQTRQYFLLAGRPDADADFSLYSWSGEAKRAPVLISDVAFPPDVTPEALFADPDGRGLHILSDDGELREPPGSPECKERPVAEERRFREMKLHIPVTPGA